MRKDDPFRKLIMRTIYMDKANYVIGVTGHPGSGKTYAAIDLAMSIDPDFNVEIDCCFTLEEFYNAMLRLDEEGNKVGRAIILDEAGVAGNSKKAMYSGQVDFGEILKMMRFKRNLFIITTPNIGDYLKDGRSLIDARVHFDKRDKTENEKLKKTKNQTRAIVRLVSTSYYNGKVFLKPIQTAADKVVNGSYFDYPPEEVVKAYERKKHNNFENVLKNNLLKLKKKRIKELIK
jgi:hypothetical protein